MKHQIGYRWTRYFLVGVLVSGMAVNNAAARRLFQRRSPACICHSTCVEVYSEVCPEVCPDVIATEPCGCSPSEFVDNGLVDNSPCAPSANFTEIHSESAPLDVGQYVGEYVSEYVGEQIIEASPVPVEWSGPAEKYVPAEVVESPLFAPPLLENPVADSSYQPIEPAAPLATPEVPLPAVAAPPETSELAEPPATTGVGDRYSNNNDLLPPATPTEAPVPTPAPIQEAPAQEAPFQEEKAEVEPPATESGMDDLFDEPIVPPTEDKQPESPLPAPQPQPEVDDLFGPLESPEAAELIETAHSVEPEALEEAPAEPTPAETDADTNKEKEDDPFHEDWTTGLDHQNSTLEKAGGLLSKTERTWTDNTASFQCEARLLRVTAKNIVLRQSTGDQRVVPLARLANVDLQFVRNQLTALRVVRARDAAAEKLLAVVWGK